MSLTRRTSSWAYAIALIGSGVVAGTYALFTGSLGAVLTAFVFTATVLCAGLLGGWKPGVLATAVSIVIAIWLFIGIRDVHGIFRLSGYAVVGIAISVLCEFVRTAGRRVIERQVRLEMEIAERRKAELAVQEQAERLREADRRKDEFLAMLAHELRNPLAPLSNALQVWPMVEDNPAEMRNLRELMQRQLRQLTRLVDDLLDVSRIARGKVQLRPQTVDLAAVVAGAVESAQPFIDQCKHSVRVSLPTDPLYVKGDTARLSQIIGNVLHNAAKYTPAKGTIHVTLFQRDSSAVLSIRDNGCGIPKHMLGQIFDMFHQVDQTLDRSQGGLGIGLTLVKRLVELHGGSIEARSEGPGKGSEFIITLWTHSHSDSLNRDSNTLPPAELLGRIPRHRILVVDDVRASADTLAMMLKSIGQDVSIANDGQTALEWIIAHHPDVVFLDIAMPGMNGYDVARQVRATEGVEKTVLAALTGYGQLHDRRTALEAGFDYHLTKPASFQSLADVLTLQQESALSEEAVRPAIESV